MVIGPEVYLLVSKHPLNQKTVNVTAWQANPLAQSTPTQLKNDHRFKLKSEKVLPWQLFSLFLYDCGM